MSRTLATSRRSKPSRGARLLWQEPPANRFRSTLSREDWTTLAVSWRYDSPKLLSKLVLDGWSGKTFLACLPLAEAAISGSSSIRWGNAGMGSPTEFWTLDSSESPNDAEECLLSDIIETGDVPQRYFLTAHNIERMKLRIEKHCNADKSELYRDLCLAGRATKHRNTE